MDLDKDIVHFAKDRHENGTKSFGVRAFLCLEETQKEKGKQITKFARKIAVVLCLCSLFIVAL